MTTIRVQGSVEELGLLWRMYMECMDEEDDSFLCVREHGDVLLHLPDDAVQLVEMHFTQLDVLSWMMHECGRAVHKGLGVKAPYTSMPLCEHMGVYVVPSMSRVVITNPACLDVYNDDHVFPVCKHILDLFKPSTSDEKFGYMQSSLVKNTDPGNRFVRFAYSGMGCIAAVLKEEAEDEE